MAHFEPNSVILNDEDYWFNQDSDLLLYIFPRETWYSITTKLKHKFGHFEALSNASPFFRDLVSQSRVNYLFKKVIKLVSPNLWNPFEENTKAPIREVLQWRQVCSQWNIAVDQLIEEKFGFFKLGFLNKKLEFITMNRWYCRRKISQFEEHFRVTHPGVPENSRNPFIRRQVVLSDNLSDIIYLSDIQSLQILSRLLSQHGSHLQKASIMYHGHLNLLQNWLVQMPNLNTLKVLNYSTVFEAVQPNSAFLQFPKMKNLQHLYVRGISFPVLKLLIASNNHVSILTMVNYSDAIANRISALHLPNLQMLERKQVKSDSQELEEIAANFQNLSNYSSCDFFH